MTDVAVITRTKSDREIADDLKDRTRLALALVLSIMDEATKSGMQIQFQLAVNGFGQNVINNLNAVKVL